MSIPLRMVGIEPPEELEDIEFGGGMLKAQTPEEREAYAARFGPGYQQYTTNVIAWNDELRRRRDAAPPEEKARYANEVQRIAGPEFERLTQYRQAQYIHGVPTAFFDPKRTGANIPSGYIHRPETKMAYETQALQASHIGYQGERYSRTEPTNQWVKRDQQLRGNAAVWYLDRPVQRTQALPGPMALQGETFQTFRGAMIIGADPFIGAGLVQRGLGNIGYETESTVYGRDLQPVAVGTTYAPGERAPTMVGHTGRMSRHWRQEVVGHTPIVRDGETVGYTSRVKRFREAGELAPKIPFATKGMLMEADLTGVKGASGPLEMILPMKGGGGDLAYMWYMANESLDRPNIARRMGISEAELPRSYGEIAQEHRAYFAEEIAPQYSRTIQVPRVMHKDVYEEFRAAGAPVTKLGIVRGEPDRYRTMLSLNVIEGLWGARPTLEYDPHERFLNQETWQQYQSVARPDDVARIRAYGEPRRAAYRSMVNAELASRGQGYQYPGRVVNAADQAGLIRMSMDIARARASEGLAPGEEPSRRRVQAEFFREMAETAPGGPQAINWGTAGGQTAITPYWHHLPAFMAEGEIAGELGDALSESIFKGVGKVYSGEAMNEATIGAMRRAQSTVASGESVRRSAMGMFIPGDMMYQQKGQLSLALGPAELSFGQMAAGAAHLFRNPTMGIRSLATLFQNISPRTRKRVGLTGKRMFVSFWGAMAAAGDVDGDIYATLEAGLVTRDKNGQYFTADGKPIDEEAVRELGKFARSVGAGNVWDEIAGLGKTMPEAIAALQKSLLDPFTASAAEVEDIYKEGAKYLQEIGPAYNLFGRKGLAMPGDDASTAAMEKLHLQSHGYGQRRSPHSAGKIPAPLQQLRNLSTFSGKGGWVRRNAAPSALKPYGGTLGLSGLYGLQSATNEALGDLVHFQDPEGEYSYTAEEAAAISHTTPEGRAALARAFSIEDRVERAAALREASLDPDIWATEARIGQLMGGQYAKRALRDPKKYKGFLGSVDPQVLETLRGISERQEASVVLQGAGDVLGWREAAGVMGYGDDWLAQRDPNWTPADREAAAAGSPASRTRPGRIAKKRGQRGQVRQSYDPIDKGGQVLPGIIQAIRKDLARLKPSELGDTSDPATLMGMTESALGKHGIKREDLLNLDPQTTRGSEVHERIQSALGLGDEPYKRGKVLGYTVGSYIDIDPQEFARLGIDPTVLPDIKGVDLGGSREPAVRNQRTKEKFEAYWSPELTAARMLRGMKTIGILPYDTSIDKEDAIRQAVEDFRAHGLVDVGPGMPEAELKQRMSRKASSKTRMAPLAAALAQAAVDKEFEIPSGATFPARRSAWFDVAQDLGVGVTPPPSGPPAPPAPPGGGPPGGGPPGDLPPRYVQGSGGDRYGRPIQQMSRYDLAHLGELTQTFREAWTAGGGEAAFQGTGRMTADQTRHWKRLRSIRSEMMGVLRLSTQGLEHEAWSAQIEPLTTAAGELVKASEPYMAAAEKRESIAIGAEGKAAGQRAQDWPGMKKEAERLLQAMRWTADDYEKAKDNIAPLAHKDFGELGKRLSKALEANVEAYESYSPAALEALKSPEAKEAMVAAMEGRATRQQIQSLGMLNRMVQRPGLMGGPIGDALKGWEEDALIAQAKEGLTKGGALGESSLFSRFLNEFSIGGAAIRMGVIGRFTTGIANQWEQAAYPRQEAQLRFAHAMGMPYDAVSGTALGSLMGRQAAMENFAAGRGMSMLQMRAGGADILSNVFGMPSYEMGQLYGDIAGPTMRGVGKGLIAGVGLTSFGGILERSATGGVARLGKGLVNAAGPAAIAVGAASMLWDWGSLAWERGREQNVVEEMADVYAGRKGGIGALTNIGLAMRGQRYTPGLGGATALNAWAQGAGKEYGAAYESYRGSASFEIREASIAIKELKGLNMLSDAQALDLGALGGLYGYGRNEIRAGMANQFMGQYASIAMMGEAGAQVSAVQRYAQTLGVAPGVGLRQFQFPTMSEPWAQQQYMMAAGVAAPMYAQLGRMPIGIEDLVAQLAGGTTTTQLQMQLASTLGLSSIPSAMGYGQGTASARAITSALGPMSSVQEAGIATIASQFGTQGRALGYSGVGLAQYYQELFQRESGRTLVMPQSYGASENPGRAFGEWQAQVRRMFGSAQFDVDERGRNVAYLMGEDPYEVTIGENVRAGIGLEELGLYGNRATDYYRRFGGAGLATPQGQARFGLFKGAAQSLYQSYSAITGQGAFDISGRISQYMSTGMSLEEAQREAEADMRAVGGFGMAAIGLREGTPEAMQKAVHLGMEGLSATDYNATVGRIQQYGPAMQYYGMGVTSPQLARVGQWEQQYGPAMAQTLIGAGAGFSPISQAFGGATPGFGGLLQTNMGKMTVEELFVKNFNMSQGDLDKLGGLGSFGMSTLGHAMMANDFGAGAGALRNLFSSLGEYGIGPGAPTPGTGAYVQRQIPGATPGTMGIYPTGQLEQFEASRWLRQNQIDLQLGTGKWATETVGATSYDYPLHTSFLTKAQREAEGVKEGQAWVGRSATVGGGTYRMGFAGQLEMAREGRGVQLQLQELNKQQAQENYDYAMFGLGRQQEAAAMQRRQALESLALQKAMWSSNVAFQRQEMGIGWEQMQTRQGWQREDFAFGRQQSGMQYEYSMGELNRNIRMASGRQKQALLRQREYMEEQFSMGESQRGKQEERWETEQQWAEEKFLREKEHFEEITSLQEEQFAMQRRHIEERYAFELAQIELQMDHLKKQKEFTDKEREITDEWNLKQSEWQEAQIQQQERFYKDITIPYMQWQADAEETLANNKAATMQWELTALNTLAQGWEDFINEIIRMLEQGAGLVGLERVHKEDIGGDVGSPTLQPFPKIEDYIKPEGGTQTVPITVTIDGREFSAYLDYRIEQKANETQWSPFGG